MTIALPNKHYNGNHRATEIEGTWIRDLAKEMGQRIQVQLGKVEAAA